MKYRQHVTRERNKELVARVKQRSLGENGRLSAKRVALTLKLYTGRWGAATYSAITLYRSVILNPAQSHIWMTLLYYARTAIALFIVGAAGRRSSIVVENPTIKMRCDACKSLLACRARVATQSRNCCRWFDVISLAPAPPQFLTRGTTISADAAASFLSWSSVICRTLDLTDACQPENKWFCRLEIGGYFFFVVNLNKLGG